MTGAKPPKHPVGIAPRRHHGVILVVAMVLIFALAALVLTLGHSMRIEATIATNQGASTQAGAIERAAEQYVLAVLASEGAGALDLPEQRFAAVAVGEGWFWILRPEYGDVTLPRFGLVDECSKLDLNFASIETLRELPGVSEELAGAIVDWRDSDETRFGGGDESAGYLSATYPYQCKNALFETVEELLLVQGVTREQLYGYETADPRTRPLFGDPALQRGLFDLLTVYSLSPGRASFPGAGDGQRVRGRINLRTAPREVLQCIQGLDPTDIDKLVAARHAQPHISDAQGEDWVSQVLGQKAFSLRDQITDTSLRYSADILAVSGDGRAFERCRIVVDVSGPAPQIIYRRDLTEQGWPMDPQILVELRAGQGLAQ